MHHTVPTCIISSNCLLIPLWSLKMAFGKAPETAFSNPGRTSLVEGEVTDREIPVQQRRRLVPTKSTWATPVTATLAAIAVATAAAFGAITFLILSRVAPDLSTPPRLRLTS